MKSISLAQIAEAMERQGLRSVDRRLDVLDSTDTLWRLFAIERPPCDSIEADFLTQLQKATRWAGMSIHWESVPEGAVLRFDLGEEKIQDLGNSVRLPRLDILRNSPQLKKALWAILKEKKWNA
jgi:hypothetical protein